MIFLGLASNLSGKQILRHFFAWGTKKDSQKLKHALAERYQAKDERVRLYHTGRSALAAGFRMIETPSQKVIIPGLTCIAVVRAVKAAGLTPVYMDIDPETLQYDWGKLRRELQEDPELRGSIILAQNTLGLALDIQELEEIAKEFDLRIIEDLAHCAGRFYSDGREIGTVGVAAALSFGKGKALDTSEGGALVLRDEKLKAPLEPLRRPKLADSLRDRWYPVFGALIRGCYHVGLGRVVVGALVKLKFITRSADAELSENVRLTHWQAKCALKQLGELKSGVLREYVLVRDRDKLLRELEKKGCYLSEIWYDTPVAPERYHKEADFPEDKCPNTVRVAQEIVNLPSWYPEERLKVARELIAQYNTEQKNEK